MDNTLETMFKELMPNLVFIDSCGENTDILEDTGIIDNLGLGFGDIPK